MLWHNDPAWSRATQFARRLLRDERGAATIEFVLWVPIFATILLAAVDATVLYLHHTEMWNVARDVGRNISVGLITEEQAAAAIEERLFLRSESYFVRTSSTKSLNAQLLIQTNVGDASVFGFFTPILGNTLQVGLVMRKEPI